MKLRYVVGGVLLGLSWPLLAKWAAMLISVSW